MKHRPILLRVLSALATSAALVFATETRPALPAQEPAAPGAEQSVSAEEPDAESDKSGDVLTDRVRVALSRPLPRSRAYVPMTPGEGSVAPNRSGAAPDTAEGAKTVSELFGREIVDFRLKSGKGRYMLEEDSGALWVLPQDAIEDIESAPDLSRSELSEQMERDLLEEFGEGFRVLHTAHFIFAYDTSDSYADWCSRLFESLWSGFELYAKKSDIPLQDCRAPLVVVIFARQRDFVGYASVETGQATGIAAYYNLQTNRAALYDLSQAEVSGEGSDGRRKRARTAESREFLSRPNAAFNVATIVHEATHQIAFNRGVFLRTGPLALWCAEGLSLLFETPNGRAKQDGWSYRGTFPANERMKSLFLRRVQTSRDPFRAVVAQDDFYRDLEASYAASWALFSWLAKKKPNALADYLKFMAEKTPCVAYSAEERIADFEKFFGNDWEKMTKTIVKYVEKL